MSNAFLLPLVVPGALVVLSGVFRGVLALDAAWSRWFNAGRQFRAERL